MDAKSIKEYIYSNDKIELILENLNMHHIQWHNGRSYISCGMPDGDNPSSTIIYNDSDFIQVKAYTRDIEDAYGISDIISLVSFIKKTIFTQSISWLCDILGLNYYEKRIKKDSALDYMSLVLNMCNNDISKNEEIKPLNENILNLYLPYNNTIFLKDNISLKTQEEFELGIDLFSHRISIPIRDEIGRLVGIKGRRAWDVVDEYNPKYIYLKQCPKSKICYGLYKTLKYIKENNTIIVCESEKGVMQLWSCGYKFSVGVGGHSISSFQQDLIIQSGAAKVIIAFDKDVDEKTIRKECQKFIKYKQVEYILDDNNILNEKESPMDNPNKWVELYEQNRKLYIE